MRLSGSFNHNEEVILLDLVFPAVRNLPRRLCSGAQLAFSTFRASIARI